MIPVQLTKTSRGDFGQLVRGESRADELVEILVTGRKRVAVVTDIVSTR